MTSDPLEALRRLLDDSHLARPEDLPDLTSRAAWQLGALTAVVFLADLEQTLLTPLESRHAGESDPVSIEGTLAGRAFADVAVVEHVGANGVTLYLPLLDATERVGVLALTFPEGTDVDGDAGQRLRDDCARLAGMLAELIVSRNAYGDQLQRTIRKLPMSVATEVQRSVLPPTTFATDRVVISGLLVPEYTAAGDTFDYAVNGSTVHLAVIDAVGHSLTSALVATVAVAAFRNARRIGLDLADTTRSMDKWLGSQFPDDQFATAIVAELDIVTGRYRWVRAGHPPALLVRGGRVVKSLPSGGTAPLGLGFAEPVIAEERLEPGDRVLLYTDGVIEARNAEGEFFGLDRLGDLVEREAAAGKPAPETLRRLRRAILAHQNGQLQDDATVLLVEWSTRPPTEGEPHVL